VPVLRAAVDLSVHGEDGVKAAPRIRAVTLDVGHTLLRGVPSWFDIWTREMAAYGRRVHREELQRAYARATDAMASRAPENEPRASWRAFNHEMILALGIDGDPRQAADRIAGAFLSVRAEFVPFDDVLEVLDAMRARGLRLAVVSNWESGLDKTLARSGLGRYFEAVVASADVRAAKPDPRIFEAALRHLGIPPSGAVHVGDSYEADVAGARAAGLHPVLLDRDRVFGDDVDCDVIRDLRDLLGILDRLERDP
jgi:putative hydrolase of the HAD superfamily